VQYKMEWRPAASRDLRRLDSPVRRRILGTIEALAANPRPPSATELASLEGWWRLRVGDYRVIYEPQNDRLVVLIIRIGHRREVYRRL
jgi:mRNA interferase RelE/StbE